MAFNLSVETAPGWVTENGFNPANAALVATDLSSGVSASVISVSGVGVSVVLKQALARLRVADLWEANPDRVFSEGAALRLLGTLTPGAVPDVLTLNRDDRVLALEQIPASARNWQTEIACERVHPHLGSWAGTTLGTWHAETAASPELVAAFGSLDSFEEQRLIPFHETVMRRRPELAEAIRPYLNELRSIRRCFVDGDYAPKNMLAESSGRCWVVDLEVAHYGNPVFDVAFFLSFVILSALRWPSARGALRELSDRFLVAYDFAAGEGFAGDNAAVAGHTACLMLARTDGLSPASFLDHKSRERAREVAIALLSRPEEGLWSWAR